MADNDLAAKIAEATAKMGLPSSGKTVILVAGNAKIESSGNVEIRRV